MKTDYYVDEDIDDFAPHQNAEQHWPEYHPSENGERAIELECEPWARDPATIPPREFLYGRHFIRKNIGATIGAGGRLKTSHGLFEAIEMVVGRNLTTGEQHDPLRVLCLNAEEDQDELDRRVAAICQRYDISEEQLGGRLFVKSVRDQPLRLAILVRGVPTLNRPALVALARLIKRKKADVFMLDPWVSFHAVNENTNTDMDLIIKQGLGSIASKTNSAGEIFHHPGKPKPGQAETTVEDARGASAIIWAVRSARVFNFMTPDEAAKLGITEDDRRRYVRISNGKANMTPLGKAEWVKIEVENLPNGDEVACSSRWKPPNPFDGVSTTDMATGAELAATGAHRADSRSPEWFGYALADLLHIPVSYGADNNAKDLARLNTIIKTWLKNKVLKIEARTDDTRRERKFIVPGSAAPHAKPNSPFDDDEITLQ
jgi:AAA domain